MHAGYLGAAGDVAVVQHPVDEPVAFEALLVRLQVVRAVLDQLAQGELSGARDVADGDVKSVQPVMQRGTEVVEPLQIALPQCCARYVSMGKRIECRTSILPDKIAIGINKHALHRAVAR